MLDRGRYKGIYPVKGVLLLDNSCFALFQPPDCDWLAAGAPWKPSWRAGAGYLRAPVPSCPRLLAPGSWLRHSDTRVSELESEAAAGRQATG